MTEKITFKILGIKINLKKNKNYIKKFYEYSCFNPINYIKWYNDLIIFFRLRQKKRKPYKIISLGEFCFSRCIPTLCGLKPRRKDGEKTLPFDLAVHSLDDVIKNLDNEFNTFFDEIEYDETQKYWVNKRTNSFYNHEKEFSKEQFIKRYKQRISNFYEYINDRNNHLYFVLSSLHSLHKNFQPFTQEKILKLIEILCRYRDSKDFELILITQTEEENKIKIPNVHVISQKHNIPVFEKMNINGDWAGEIKRRHTKEAIQIYKDIVWNLLEIIK